MHPLGPAGAGEWGVCCWALWVTHWGRAQTFPSTGLRTELLQQAHPSCVRLSQPAGLSQGLWNSLEAKVCAQTPCVACSWGVLGKGQIDFTLENAQSPRVLEKSVGRQVRWWGIWTVDVVTGENEQTGSTELLS